MDFNLVSLKNKKAKESVRIEEVSSQEIAIIGIGMKFPLADHVEQFWSNLQQGVDCVRSMPETRRKDADQFAAHFLKRSQHVEYDEGAYLDEIDKFDYSFFRLSPKEASLMDPNQKLFTEVAWTALEDAGYGGDKLLGSRTGVYVGYGSETDYKRLIAEVEQESLSYSLPGNTRPIIASRLSYLLDFRGPSMLIDTTCSSSLVAIHQACHAIRKGECDQAIAGGVQIHLMPVRQTDIGVKSSDGRAKTFDDSSDGTGTGEGVAAILLKPLHKAQKDGDQIYAVIKGSAVNHDGASIGITAPNAVAQEDCLVNAWKDAGVHPETIQYLEAHGTGTELGDPIEVEGITRAFNRYTKRQGYCGIGAVKSNIGHLDNSAGIAGLLKVVMALKHKQLPPTLHFNYPNRKIAFEESPLFVVDRLMDWELNDNSARRAGVSSFGLSGTNCHIVLEEAPTMQNRSAHQEGPHLLALSARTKNGVEQLVRQYCAWLENGQKASALDICYTANGGRGHYQHRLAIVFQDIAELSQKLGAVRENGVDSTFAGVFYGEHRISNKADRERPETRSYEDIEALTAQAQQTLTSFVAESRQSTDPLCALASVYASGATIDWNALYQGMDVHHVSLPTYPFERNRSWIESSSVLPRSVEYGAETGSSLLDRLVVESADVVIYATNFSVERHWMLSEHKIQGNCVLVGTTYLETAIQAFQLQEPDAKPELSDIVFLAPLVLVEGETREVQLVLKSEQDGYEFSVLSAIETPGGEKTWVKHVGGKIAAQADKTSSRTFDITGLKTAYQDGFFVPNIDRYNEQSAFEFGPRWYNLKEMYLGDQELLTYIALPEQFQAELDDFVIYPSLMDNALATMPLLEKALSSKAFSGEAGVFMPFSYKRFAINRPMPAQFYSFVKAKQEITEQAGIVTFDLCLIDLEGHVFAEIENYTLKRTEKNLASVPLLAADHLYFQLDWMPEPILTASSEPVVGSVLVFADETGFAPRLQERLVAADREVIRVRFGDSFARISDNEYRVDGSAASYRELFARIRDRNITHLVHLMSVGLKPAHTLDGLQTGLQQSVMSLFHLSRCISELERQNMRFLIAGEHVYDITGQEAVLHSEAAAMFGLAKVIGQEVRHVTCTCIDFEPQSEAAVDHLLDELFGEVNAYQVAYRDGNRFVERFHEVTPSEAPQREVELRENGVYVITGGLGGIGLAIAKSLAEQQAVKLALVGRSPRPEETAADAKQAAKWNAVREIEQLGSTVAYYAADVADEQELQEVLQNVRATHGSIRGIVHSAGVAGDGFLLNKAEETFTEVLAPKIQGTWLLDRLTQADELDFFVCFSSNNTLMGMPGQSDYTAANLYQVAFAAQRSRSGRHALTINWPAWKETGMAVDFGVNVDSIFKALPTATGLDAFAILLRTAWTNVIVGEINPGASAQGITFADAKLRMSPAVAGRLDGAKRKPASNRKATRRKQSQQLTLQGKSGQVTDVERIVAEIWRDVLGFDELSVYDNFFGIGGDSILLTKVHALLEDEFPGRVTVADLFTYTTIADIAGYLSQGSQDTGATGQEMALNQADMEQTILGLLDEFERGSLSLNEVLQAYAELEVLR